MKDKIKTILLLDRHIDIYLPNEIFNDFISCSNFKNWQQQAFAYSFYYLSCYLYRNCIYSKTTNINQLTVKSLKEEVLQVAGKTFTDIYKQDGILDGLGYTQTERDIPVFAEMDAMGTLTGFETFSNFQERTKASRDIPSYFQFKLPLKAFYKEPKNHTTKYNGHFFNLASTHKIQAEAFVNCLSNPKIGYKGFYLYGFYRRQSDFYRNGYNATIKQIQEIIPISEKTLLQYHRELESLDLISKTVRPHAPNIYKAKSN